MEMRKKIYLENKIKLKDKNFFVSRTRLAVMNLPPSCAASQLKQIFSDALDSNKKKLHPKNVIIASSKKDKKPLNFGFVEFENHEDSLSALRAINNNPSIPGKYRKFFFQIR